MSRPNPFLPSFQAAQQAHERLVTLPTRTVSPLKIETLKRRVEPKLKVPRGIWDL